MLQTVLYDRFEDRSVRCNICRHRCTIAAGARGICRVRENRDGALVSLVEGKIIAASVDPIEKKPLYHILPGSKSFSLASAGCNFSCRFCQNADIAKYDDRGTGIFPGHLLTPGEAVKKALESGSDSISFTYTEPTVWLEYALATGKIATEAGLYNIFVTNGYITPEALDLISPVLHAANIDLKGMTESFYKKLCGARLSQVLECIIDYRKRGIWIEITTLVITGENDSKEELEAIAKFIANELGPDTPWHISRFFPRHKMSDRTPTDRHSLEVALEAGYKAGLRYLYEGNVEGGMENTLCPYCGALVIGRNGYRITAINLDDGSCMACGKAIAGIWGQMAQNRAA